MEHISKGRVRLTCVRCSTEFETYLSTAKRREDHTCSLSCARSHWPNRKRERVTLKCERCSSTFEVAKGRDGSGRKPKARFCSVACKNLTQKGAGHPSYIDGRAEARMKCRAVIAQRILEEGKCEECGSTAFLHGHHIKSFAKFPEHRNEPKNIQVLCSECHAAKHPDQARKLFSSVPRSGSDIECSECATKFYVKKSHLDLRRTCSRVCAANRIRRLARLSLANG